MLEAAEYCDSQGYDRFVINEIEMSVANLTTDNSDVGKWLDNDYIAYHRESMVPVGAYSPSAGGIFVKYLRDGNTEAWDNRHKRDFATEHNFEVARRLDRLSKETGFSVVQLQLAWVMSSPYGFPSFPIIGCRTVKQLEDSLGAVEANLTDDMIKYLTVPF